MSIRHFLSLILLWFAVHAVHAQPLMDYSKAEEYEIASVRVEGTEFLDPKILATLSGLRPGDKIKVPGEDISKALKTLWKQKLFTNISIETEQINGKLIFLVIKVEERPRISRYTLRGVKNGESEELRKKLELRAGIILTDNLKMRTAGTIRDFYVDKGFLNTEVTITEKTDTLLKNSVLVRVDVKKGSKVKVQNIFFEGNSTVTTNKLKSRMKETREKVKFDLNEMLRFKKNIPDSVRKKIKWYKLPGEISLLRFYDYADRFVNLNIFKASKFKRNDYEEDKKKVIEYYNSKGYRDARIVEDTFWLEDEKNLNVRIRLDEGRQYYFRNIYWEGNSKYSDSLLAKILSIRRGEVYNQKALDDKLFMNPNGGDVSSLYMDDGYLFFSVVPNEIKIEGDSIDLLMRVNEGPQATIRDVRIIGNTKTNEKVIRRELRTLPGNKFSRSDLIRSQREIVNLGYFDPQQLDVVPIPNPENGTVDIEYRVTEKPSDQLELSAGYGGRGQGLVGTLGVSFTNFSVRNIFDKKAWTPLPAGDGERFSVRVQSGGIRNQFYTVSFTEPWLGGKKPNSLTASFNRTRINNIDFNNQIIGKYIATGFSLGINTRLKWPDDFFNFDVAVNFQRYQLDNANFFFIINNGNSTNLNLSLDLSRSSIDQPLYPKSGSLLSFQVTATLPYSLMFKNRRDINYADPELPSEERYKWIEYHKWKITAEWYVNIVQNLVFKTSAKLGFLGLYNKKLGFSPFERFEVGGDGLSNTQILGRDIISMRGYPIFTPSGGAPIFNKFSMELRYPISLNPSATIFALAFAEAGNYWTDIRNYRPYDLARSVGMGVRVFLPMFGLLGFDYGIGFDRDKLGLLPKQGNNIFARYGEFRIILGFEPQ